jgi:hypothetical protein
MAARTIKAKIGKTVRAQCTWVTGRIMKRTSLLVYFTLAPSKYRKLAALFYLLAILRLPILLYMCGFHLLTYRSLKPHKLSLFMPPSVLWLNN